VTSLCPGPGVEHFSNSGQSEAVDITVELFCPRVPKLSSMICDVRVEVLMSLFLKVF
jgi:hypothetical protein